MLLGAPGTVPVELGAGMPRPERTALPPLPTWAAYFGPTLRPTVDSIFAIVADTESGLLRA